MNGPGPAALAATLAVLAGTGLGIPVVGGWAGTTAPQLSAVPARGVAATVTWNGANVSGAGSALSAFVIGAGQSAQVVIAYGEAPGTSTVVNATLALELAGITLSSESVHVTTLAGTGRAELNWTFGSLVYLLEGVYQLEAELLDANGTLLFLQAFFVTVRAPYLFGSVILDLAVVLLVVEAAWIRSVIRYRTGRRRRRRPP